MWRFDWSVRVVKSSVDLCCLQCVSIQIRGTEGRGEQRCCLRTKALMRDLGARLECRHRVFVRTGKHCGNKSIAAQLYSNLLPSDQ